MATATSTLTINPAFLQEIKEDHQELWTLLAEVREHCRPPKLLNTPTTEWCELLERLRDRLAMHFALEEAYGYFQDALSAAPRLSEEAETLRGEHSTLFVQLCQIVDQVDGLRHHETPIWRLPMLVERLLKFDARFQQHEAAENELIQRAFQQDIGVGD